MLILAQSPDNKCLREQAPSPHFLSGASQADLFENDLV
ncbi:hypothetical protein SORDD20_00426 [Streptococcus oralis]|nr:hypothetical protein SORDD20_00426 [Streptococcus oralis]